MLDDTDGDRTGGDRTGGDRTGGDRTGGDRTDGTVQRRNSDELVGLLTPHKNEIFGFIFCMVHSLQDAEDIFQQAVITMWNKFDQFEPGSNFLPWACRIARYKALNFIKSKRRARVYFSEDLISELAEQEAEQTEALEARLRALATCRQKLSSGDQALLALCYGDSGTIRDAAERIGRPVGSVYDSLSRIRRALYLCIERTLAQEGFA
jgi:RNA polymerase sigma-70 factor, ECF subfamily